MNIPDMPMKLAFKGEPISWLKPCEHGGRGILLRVVGIVDGVGGCGDGLVGVGDALLWRCEGKGDGKLLW